MILFSGFGSIKGVISVFIAFILGLIIGETNKALLVQIAGIFVIIGHTFPIFFEFRGGKGVATALGVLITTNYQIGLICLVFALVIMAITRMVSIGSVLAAILFPILTIFIHNNYLVQGTEGMDFGYIIYGIIIGLFVCFNHRENIK